MTPETTTKRVIQLPQGGELEVDITPAFIAKCKQHFGLLEQEQVDDDHVRMFIFGAMKTAVDKAEKAMEQ